MDTIPGMLEAAAGGWIDETALREPRGGEVEETTYRDLYRRVTEFGRGLVSKGVEPGDRVFLLSDNSPRWLVADLGIQWAGAVCVPRGADTTPDEAAYILRHSGAAAAVVEEPKLIEVLPDGARELKCRVTLEGSADGATGFEELLEAGAAAGGEPQPQEIATIVYTSGTTGDPKGVVLSHWNILHQIRVLPSIIAVRQGMRFLCVLPSWHMFERTVEYYALSRGGVLSYAGLRTLKQDLAREAPQVLTAVPRLWGGIHGAFLSGLAKKRGLGKAIAKLLAGSALGWAYCRKRWSGTIHEGPSGGGVPGRILAGLGVVLLAPLGALGRKVVGSKIRAALGGKLLYGVSGGSHLPLHLDRFIDAMGVNLLAGYGLTETSPVICVRRPERNVLGTMGVALPETTVRIVDLDGAELGPGLVGELEVSGPQVMKGYYEDPVSTKQVFTEDGYFRTGDLVERTKKGDYVFRGRCKDTICTAGGENVEPAPIETEILRSPFIRQVVVVGHDRKVLGALVVPEPELAEGEAAERRITVKDLVSAEIKRLVNARTGFKAREQIGRVAVLDREFTVADGTLTRTLKLRRNIILSRYEDLIEELYGRGA